MQNDKENLLASVAALQEDVNNIRTLVKKMMSVNLNTHGETSWAKASVETVRNLLNEHYEGKLNIYDFWGVGDEREIAMGGEINETVQFVLTDKMTYCLAKRPSTMCAFTVDQKNTLRDTRRNFMTASNSLTADRWDECYMRRWINATYTYALAEDYEGLFKEFIVETEVVDKFSLRSEVEIFGKPIYGEDSGDNQIEWYKQTRNRLKLLGSDDAAPRWYWLRSHRAKGNGFCCVTSRGDAARAATSKELDIAPFGCI